MRPHSVRSGMSMPATLSLKAISGAQNDLICKYYKAPFEAWIPALARLPSAVRI